MGSGALVIGPHPKGKPLENPKQSASDGFFGMVASPTLKLKRNVNHICGINESIRILLSLYFGAVHQSLGRCQVQELDGALVKANCSILGKKLNGWIQ